jgi:hypothetical protein
MTPGPDSPKRSYLRKLEERASRLYDTLELPNGELVEIGPRDRVECIISLLQSDEERQASGGLHWLARRIIESDSGVHPADVTSDDFVAICLAIGRSSRREFLGTE